MIWGALVGGLVGTVVLTTMLRGASDLGMTRMDIPFLLGTAVTSDRMRAKAFGFALHFAFGLLFALAYYAVFVTLDRSGVLRGALLGLLHGLVAGSTPLLEPPGALLLNYGRQTPVATLLAHVAYGAIVGGFTSLAS